MSQIRNVAVLSHSGAGKTSLTEAILYRAGTLTTLGKVEEGTSRSDHTAEEKRRKISIWSTVHPFEWKGESFNIIDTPGYADFVGELRAGLRAADAALFVVSAVDGMDAATAALWEECAAVDLSLIHI